jgi:hypothetical protein
MMSPFPTASLSNLSERAHFERTFPRVPPVATVAKIRSTLNEVERLFKMKRQSMMMKMKKKKKKKKMMMMMMR